MEAHSLIAEKEDPSIILKLPVKILKDLVMRAKENGNTSEFEIIKRLARSLERDLEMIEEDNRSAYRAFKTVQDYPFF